MRNIHFGTKAGADGFNLVGVADTETGVFVTGGFHSLAIGLNVNGLAEARNFVEGVVAILQI